MVKVIKKILFIRIINNIKIQFLYIMSKIPKVVFIVPYRNRPQHKFFFSNYLKTIMDESNLKDDYEVYSHINVI